MLVRLLREMIFLKASIEKAPFALTAVRKFTAHRSDAKNALLNSPTNRATHKPTPYNSVDDSGCSM